MIRGWLTIEPGASLTAPTLGLIDGWLTLGGQLTALHLTEVRQDLAIGGDGLGTTDTIIDLPALRIVGTLTLARGMRKGLLVLKEIRENLTLLPDTRLHATQLERIGRSLTLREHAQLVAPVLNFIGGYADINESAAIDAPKFRA
jgi:hypothetical protein